MTRATHLALVLVIVVLSLMPVTAPIAAQQALPPELIGRWEGLLVQVDANSQRSEYPVTIDLTAGTTGSVVGTINYPTLGCAGNVVLRGVATDVTLTERLTVGQSICRYPDAAITLRPQPDGTLVFGWSHPNWAGTLTGTLLRTGGASPSTTGGPSQNDWCAQLAATYGPAPTLSGPWYGPLEQRVGTYTRVNAGVSVSDFVTTAVVYNPTASTTVPWDFGFAFRETADAREVQQIIIASNGTWYYAYWSTTYPDQGVQASGQAASFNFSPGAPNTLDLVVSGQLASFCLNGQFVSTVQLPPAVASDVYLATGLFDTTVVGGRVIDYEGFAVWA